ncbi:MAG: hypothetical protein ISS70_13410 [Phycisphaerae bacterium]|nr:hypothetical protein [Phycisphaerae bacterium]
MIPEAYTKDFIESLPPQKRQEKLRELETVLNANLKGCADLKGWQDRLYSLIEELNGLGFFLGRWDYDSEVETWGGPSYMDPTRQDDLLLRSQFPVGVTLAWQDYEELNKRQAEQ